jgi:hypothetical protein
MRSPYTGSTTSITDAHGCPGRSDKLGRQRGADYRTGGPREHYACPRCFEERKIRILQDNGVNSEAYHCPECNKQFAVGKPERLSPSPSSRGWT